MPGAPAVFLLAPTAAASAAAAAAVAVNQVLFLPPQKTPV
jgi:hypothetical protein